MKIYQLEVKNFRGIRGATFEFPTSLVCLIGLGDSTKTTILDAIEYALCPNWFIPIDDSDFTNCDVREPIEITTTIGPIPEDLMSVDKKYGSYLRGWDAKKNELHDEPIEGDVYVLSIRLTIDNTLTPEWWVVTERPLPERHVSYRDRQRFAVSRIGGNIDNELAWTRGSSLLRMSKDKKEAEGELLEANRTLREIDLTNESFRSLTDSVQKAKDSGKAYALNTDHLKANIDPKNLRGSASTISLHDGDVPFRRMGLGSRRLMSIGLQLSDIENGAILLVDEIEQALEPHRLKHLLRTLQKKKNEVGYGQVFLTTHSPATLEELGAEPVYCIHYNRNNKTVEMMKIDSSIQGTFRRMPEAFLSPKVIVCEGQTEIGLLRAFEKQQINTMGDTYSFAYNKTAIVNGEGSSASPERAYHLAKHNYKTCLFIDSDEMSKWTVAEEKLKEKHVNVIRWDNENNTEMQVFSDVPKVNINGLLTIAKENTGINDEAILQSINSRLVKKMVSLDDIKEYEPELELRNAIAKSASQNEWFKSISKAEKLGDHLFGVIWDSMRSTVIYKKFEDIQNWAKDE